MSRERVADSRPYIVYYAALCWSILVYSVVRNPAHEVLTVRSCFLGLLFSAVIWCLVAHLGFLYRKQRFMELTLVILSSLGVGHFGMLYSAIVDDSGLEQTMLASVGMLGWAYVFVRAIGDLRISRAMRRKLRAEEQKPEAVD